jgi:asparagine synthase (glutamine-hydrolysing)
MCGICGVYKFEGPVCPDGSLGLMVESLRHRGRVSSEWYGGRAALGARRLPIVDLLNSPQPVFNEDRTVVIVGNGEIYNHKELRHELQMKGHRFSTDGDLECILHLYEEEGENLWGRLRGMFGMALYDLRQDLLLLARDPMGIKPVFYYLRDQMLLFGSEIKAITAHPSFQAELNPQAISDYLSLQFIPKPQTIYKGVLSLPQGSYLKVHGPGLVQVKRYWNITVSSDARPRDEREVAEQAFTLLSTAVKRRLMSDVPLGVLLSGGLDSSAVAVLAAEMHTEPIKTFSIVFREQGFDESPFSREMARFLKSDHHELVLDYATIVNSMEEIGSFFDEPFCEASSFAIYHMCRYAKDYVTVILAGEGADEIFCGYDFHLAQHLAGYYRLVPGFLREMIRRLAILLPTSPHKAGLDQKLKRFTDGVRYDFPKSHFWWFASLNDEQKRGLLAPDFLETVDRPDTSQLYAELFESFNSEDALNRLMAIDCSVPLADCLLLRADRMSMAHTMELRVPFLDVDLVNFAFSLPSRFKISGFRNKLPIRNAFLGRMPERIRTRTKKGLTIPYQTWFINQGKELLFDNLTGDRVNSLGIFREKSVEALLEDHFANRRNNATPLWVILNLALWLERNA